MIGKFNVYDFLADLLPGLLVLWCLQQILESRGFVLPIAFGGDFTETSILVVFGFVTGLFVQRVGERFADPVLMGRIPVSPLAVARRHRLFSQKSCAGARNETFWCRIRT